VGDLGKNRPKKELPKEGGGKQLFFWLFPEKGAEKVKKQRGKKSLSGMVR